VEYLQLARRLGTSAKGRTPIELILADGTVHSEIGRVTVAERAVDEATGTLTMIAEFPNPGHVLRPGQFGRVRASATSVENALLIPQQAVMEQQSAKTVYVVDSENKVALRTVSLGPRYEDLFVVTGGVEAGERVMTEGMQKVRPGMVVAPAGRPVAEK
jgi:membrane fusion protein (multidrug efflux system)